jgi:cob(I)alamin adenosyltransferase
VSRIATGTGDKGHTGLFDGSRVPKSHALIEALGDVDELDAALGVAAAESGDPSLREEIKTIQDELFTLKADLATPMKASKPVRRIERSEVKRLETLIDSLEAAQPRLKVFIRNSGAKLATHLHLARAIARRAERSSWKANSQAGGLNPDALVYINRLSDFLFLLARQANINAGIGDDPMRPLK